MTNKATERQASRPGLVGIITCEVVLSQADFFISVNGINPSEYGDYTINDIGCIVFRSNQSEVLTTPLPPALLDLVAVAPQALFVRVVDGVPDDAKILKHYDRETDNVH